MLDDHQLLARYAADGSEAAFRELVGRHVNLVYSAALRRTGGDAHLAQDVAQLVFTDLARKSRSISRDVVLAGWLHRATRFASDQLLRTERRRRQREQEAVAMNALESEPAPDWRQIRPLLDEALDQLGQTDRDALLLRFFEQRSLAEVGQVLGANEDAARKRVSRALEKVRVQLARHGLTTTAGALSAAISIHAVQAAPANLAATFSSAALAGAAVHTSTFIATLQAIAMTTVQKTLMAAALAAAVGAGIYEARQVSRLRGQIQVLEQQQTALAGRNRELEQERDEAVQRLAALAGARSTPPSDAAALLRLRGEVTQLRQESLQSPAARMAALKTKLEQMPERKIPELQFATEQEWAGAAWDADLETDDGVREALSKLRESAINTFLNVMMKVAFKKYLAAHDGILPGDLDQLKPYFDAPVTDAMLQRYRLLQSGKPDYAEELVRLVAYADEDYDSNHSITVNGASGGRFNRVREAVETAAQAFAAANNGQSPTDPSQIAPYLEKPIEAATIKKYLNGFAADPWPPERATLAPVVKAYSDANGGQGPQSAFDLVPYLTTPEQQSAFLKMEGLPPEATTLVAPLKSYIEAHNGQPPAKASDLQPYLTSPEQAALCRKLEEKLNSR